MKLRPRIGVVTPTTGSPKVIRNIKSVANQTYTNLVHYVVIDGPKFVNRFSSNILEDLFWSLDVQRPKDLFEELFWFLVRTKEGIGKYVKIIKLPENTGANRFNGHRIYGATSFLLNVDYIAWLDEDNWLEPNHFETLVDLLNNGCDWGYALRMIHDKDGKPVCLDSCESLGFWPSVIGKNDFLIDTNCYFLPTHIAVNVAPYWYRKTRDNKLKEPDREICDVLRRWHLSGKFIGGCTGQYTVNYTAGSRKDSVQPEFFLRGNTIMAQRYGEGKKFPWIKNLKKEKE